MLELLVQKPLKFFVGASTILLLMTSSEAYNSIYTYDLIDIVETHLDDAIDQERLTLKWYYLTASNHPLHIRKDGVGLYAKELLSKKHRPGMTTLSKCIVCEIHLDRKNTFCCITQKF